MEPATRMAAGDTPRENANAGKAASEPTAFETAEHIDAATPIEDETSIYATKPPTGNEIATPSEILARIDQLPRELGRYRLERLLGRGGMGRVYLAYDTQLRRYVALKIPSASEEDRIDLNRRLLREAKAAAALSHLNICPVFDAGVEGNTFYLTMEFIDGKSLSQSIRENGPMDPVEATAIVTTIALAMEFAHQRGVVHRDLKPANILLRSPGEPVVTDFGLACVESSEELTKLTATGALLGTPAYMPPEQISGMNEAIGPASDVYSLGVILYELLAGRTPFVGSPGAVMGQVLYEAPPSLRDFRPDVPPTLVAICERCLHKRIADRFSSMQQLADALYSWSTEGATPNGGSPPTSIGVGPTPAAFPPGSNNPLGPAQTELGIRAAAAKPRAQSRWRLGRVAAYLIAFGSLMLAGVYAWKLYRHPTDDRTAQIDRLLDEAELAYGASVADKNDLAAWQKVLTTCDGLQQIDVPKTQAQIASFRGATARVALKNFEAAAESLRKLEQFEARPSDSDGRDFVDVVLAAVPVQPTNLAQVDALTTVLDTAKALTPATEPERIDQIELRTINALGLRRDWTSIRRLLETNVKQVAALPNANKAAEQFLVAHGREDLRNGKYNAFVEFFDNCPLTESTKSALTKEAAIAYLGLAGSERPETAAVLVRKAMKVDPQNFDAYRLKVDLLLRQPADAKRFDDGVTLLELGQKHLDRQTAKRLAVHLTPAFAEHGRNAFAKGDIDRMQAKQVVENFGRVLTLDPKNPEARFYRGLARRAIGRQSGNGDDCRKAITDFELARSEPDQTSQRREQIQAAISASAVDLFSMELNADQIDKALAAASMALANAPEKEPLVNRLTNTAFEFALVASSKGRPQFIAAVERDARNWKLGWANDPRMKLMQFLGADGSGQLPTEKETKSAMKLSEVDPKLPLTDKLAQRLLAFGEKARGDDSLAGFERAASLFELALAIDGRRSKAVFEKQWTTTTNAAIARAKTLGVKADRTWEQSPRQAETLARETIALLEMLNRRFHPPSDNSRLHANAWLVLAALRFKENNPIQARNACQTAATLAPTYSIPQAFLADAHWLIALSEAKNLAVGQSLKIHAADVGAAVVAACKAIELDPESQSALFRLKEIMLKEVSESGKPIWGLLDDKAKEDFYARSLRSLGAALESVDKSAADSWAKKKAKAALNEHAATLLLNRRSPDDERTGYRAAQNAVDDSERKGFQPLFLLAQYQRLRNDFEAANRTLDLAVKVPDYSARNKVELEKLRLEVTRRNP